jgi:glycosyltransferase involved in cell wall biosynthesis
VRVVVVSGIWPPDVGGPATPASDLFDELRARGHSVRALSLTDEREVRHDDGVTRWPRRRPWPFRHLSVAWWLFRNRSDYDVVYATGMHASAVLGGRIARRPVAAKVVGDPVWERAARRGLTSKGFDAFQSEGEAGARVRAMRAARDRWVRRASAVVVPSNYLRDVVRGWVGDAVRVRVIPNGVRGIEVASQSEVTSGSLRCVYVGRLVAHKNVDVVIEAVAGSPGVTLEVVGAGPERKSLERLATRLQARERISFAGGLEHRDALAHIAHADVLVTASGYEGLPHVALEALACATPVVSASSGGLTAVVRHGHNGLLLNEPDAGELAAALEKLRDDRDLLARLSANARVDSSSWTFGATADGIETLLRELVYGKPRVVFVGKTRIADLPRDELRRRHAILLEHLSPTVIGVGSPGIRSIEGVRTISFPELRPRAVGSALFYLCAPVMALALGRGRRRAIVCRSPFDALGVVALRGLIPGSARVVVELHGDWRSAPRLYGGRARRLLGPASDRAGSWAVRRADEVRSVSSYTASLARAAGFRGEIDTYTAFGDLSTFEDPALVDLPRAPEAAFVGALETGKGLDVLLTAWARLEGPPAQLSVAGDGSQRRRMEDLAREFKIDDRVRFLGRVSRSEVRALIDECWVVVMPSRSEGLGRVALEAMARGRAVVGSRVGGLTELVVDGANGLLVAVSDPDALATALSELLADRDKARAMGAEGRRRFEMRPRDKSDFESGIERLARRVYES